MLHAHYATSYGLLGALTNYHPFIISVWGWDVYHFPRTTPIHRWLLEYNLRSADAIASTSHTMAKETGLYTNKQIHVTPFGVDTNVFRPREASTIWQPGGRLTIGNVKALEPEYGIPVLIRAFAAVSQQCQDICLVIVGNGSQKDMLLEMIKRVGLENRVYLMPAVPHQQVPGILKGFDIFVVPSLSESFGVAAVEASACGLPVIASRVGGLPEVIEDEITGILVSPGDQQALTVALRRLIDSPELRRKMGEAGRLRVEQRYSWEKSVDIMDSLYRGILRKSATD